MKIKNNLLNLFLTFLKIGAFTFGGGYAMIAVLEREFVENKKWLSHDEFLEIVAIAESTPGPIAINMATFVGFKVCGFWGAFFSTMGVILPSFVIIAVISNILNLFGHLKAVEYAFNGIRAGVLALIVKALWSMYKQCPKKIVSYLIMAGAFVAAAFLKVNVLIIIICCAVVGLTVSYVSSRGARK